VAGAPLLGAATSGWLLLMLASARSAFEEAEELGGLEHEAAPFGVAEVGPFGQGGDEVDY